MTRTYFEAPNQAISVANGVTHGYQKWPPDRSRWSC